MLIVLGWFFLTFWDGRVTKLQFESDFACQTAQADATKYLGSNRVTPCRRDER